MKYGHFSDDGREYIITNPLTPRPWVNYLTNGRYTSIMSQVASGYSFQYDAFWHPVSMMGSYLLQEAMPGKFLYIRDNDSAKYWAATVGPMMTYGDFEARHGFGYTRILNTVNDIKSDITFFIDPKDDVEEWIVEITNKSSTVRNLSLFSYAELICGNIDWEYMGSSWFASSPKKLRFENGVLKAAKHAVPLPKGGSGRWPYDVFMTSSLRPAGYEGSKEKFIGIYRTLQNPLAVETGIVSSKPVEGEMMAGTLKWDISLKPGECIRYSIALGVVNPHDDRADTLINRYKNLATADASFTAAKKWWNTMIAGVDVQTPDKDLNLDCNNWIKYQSLINMFTWRDSNWYYGVGSEGVGAGGYRNILCDALGTLPLDLATAKDHLRTIVSYSDSKGNAAHAAPRPELNLAPRNFGSKTDDPLWLAYTIDAYIKESGDTAFLTEEVPYTDNKSDPVWRHIVTGIDQMVDTAGDKGLPLIGTGDWNDALDKVGPEGKGQSVWQGMFLSYILDLSGQLFAQCIPNVKEAQEVATRWQKKAEELKVNINKHCFNGDWFVRAFKDNGSAIGDKSNKEGKIYIEPQVWSVITNTTTPERMNKAVQSALDNLGTKFGWEILSPAYTTYDDSIGHITAFAPGSHENGAVFSHSNTFAIIALLMLGRGDEGYNLYKNVTTIGKTDNEIDFRGLEPYAQCQYVEGRGSQNFGKGSCHWLTGTSSWLLKAITEFMIGIKPEYTGLRIAPSVPKSWETFSATRRFRGCMYKISFSNPSKVSTGVKSITVDGEVIKGDVIPAFTDGGEHEVLVVMG